MNIATQLPLCQYLHRVSAIFRLPRHHAICIYKSKMAKVDAIVLTPAQGFKLESLQDDVGDHPLHWMFYGKPYYFVWLGPSACLVPIIQLRQVIGEANDHDEVRLAQWQKLRPRLQRCKQAPDNCECDPLAQKTATMVGYNSHHVIV
jgi:hypothetical protein